MDERGKRVLKALIDLYIEKGEPIGSLTIAERLGNIYSPSTIRNVLSNLEKEGFLVHPSVSSGRIPTDKALRFFVENLMERRDDVDIEVSISGKLKDIIDKVLDIKDLAKLATSALSECTNQVAFMVFPITERLVIRRVYFVPVADDVVMVVATMDKGFVMSGLVRFGERVSSFDLDRLSNIINTEFSGKTVEEIERGALVKIERDIADYYSTLKKLRTLYSAFVSMIEDFNGEMYIEGTSNILLWLDIVESVEKLKELARSIEDRKRILKIVRRFIKENKWLAIGSEIGDEGLDDLVMVISDCRGKLFDGVIGIFAPKKVNYSFVIPLVEKTARCISGIL